MLGPLADAVVATSDPAASMPAAAVAMRVLRSINLVLGLEPAGSVAVSPAIGAIDRLFEC
jgi:hypothetical protein